MPADDRPVGLRVTDAVITEVAPNLPPTTTPNASSNAATGVAPVALTSGDAHNRWLNSAPLGLLRSATSPGHSRRSRQEERGRRRCGRPWPLPPRCNLRSDYRQSLTKTFTDLKQFWDI